MQNLHLYTEKSIGATSTRPFGEVGEKFPLQLSLQTHFAKIEDKKVIAKNSSKHFISWNLRINIRVTVHALKTTDFCKNIHFLICEFVYHVQPNKHTDTAMLLHNAILHLTFNFQ